MTARILTCLVEEVENLTPDVFRVTLQGRSEAVNHAPGQYLELKLDEDTWVPFSIANAPRGDGSIELHIQHWPERRNSSRLRELLHGAGRLTLRMPSGQCVLDPYSTRPLLLVAAGTGFAQMKAIVEAALSDDPERRISLWWAVRERRDFYLEQLPREWAARYPGLHFHAVSESAPEEALEGEGVSGHLGRIDTALASTLGYIADHDVYLSGSPSMVYACIDVLASLELQASRVFSDVFAYAPRDPLVPSVGSLLSEPRGAS